MMTVIPQDDALSSPEIPTKETTTKEILASQKETHLKVIELFSFYKQSFLKVISDEPPHFAWGKCEKLVKPLIRQYGLERMKDMVSAYINSDNKFYKEANWGLEVFLSSAVINALLPKTNGHK